jgi:hypothetical protein
MNDLMTTPPRDGKSSHFEGRLILSQPTVETIRKPRSNHEQRRRIPVGRNPGRICTSMTGNCGRRRIW